MTRVRGVVAGARRRWVSMREWWVGSPEDWDDTYPNYTESYGI